MVHLWQWMYRSKIASYGPEYYAVSYGRVACMLLCMFVYALCVWQDIYCSSSQGLDHLKHLDTLNLYPHCTPSVNLLMWWMRDFITCVHVPARFDQIQLLLSPAENHS